MLLGRSLYNVLRAGFPVDRNKAALRLFDGTEISYKQLEARSSMLANALSDIGLQPGDRVAVQIDKSPEALFLYLACLQGGFVYLPMNVAYQASEVAHILSDSSPTIYICRSADLSTREHIARSADVKHVFTLDAAGGGSLSELCDVSPDDRRLTKRAGDDLAALLYTSGTTGKPKGVMLTHNNLITNAEALLSAWEWNSQDVLLHALPLFHTHGLFVACHCALLGGSTMIYLYSFDVDTVISSLPRATVLMGVPTFYVRLLKHQRFDGELCRNIRLFISGSAPLLETTFMDFFNRTGHSILERYGMTETGMISSNPIIGDRIAGTVGLALPNVGLRLVDDNDRLIADSGNIGKVQVRGVNVFKGYWRQPEKTSEEFTVDGYFRTGDLGEYNDSGYLRLVGRDKDLIISGGFNVYPKEVELLLDRLDGVIESAVVGLPHPDLGEVVTGVVVGDQTVLSEHNMLLQLKHALAGYKVPKTIVFRKDLPRNSMGKVQKNVLRDELKGTLFNHP